MLQSATWLIGSTIKDTGIKLHPACVVHGFLDFILLPVKQEVIVVKYKSTVTGKTGKNSEDCAGKQRVCSNRLSRVAWCNVSDYRVSFIAWLH